MKKLIIFSAVVALLMISCTDKNIKPNEETTNDTIVTSSDSIQQIGVIIEADTNTMK